MKKTFVLVVLFILPIVAYLFFASGVNNFGKLATLTENVDDISDFSVLDVASKIAIKTSDLMVIRNPYVILGLVLIGIFILFVVSKMPQSKEEDEMPSQKTEDIVEDQPEDYEEPDEIDFNPGANFEDEYGITDEPSDDDLSDDQDDKKNPPKKD